MNISDLSRRAEEIQESIRGVLYERWDPIGICGEWPRNEYDAYIGGVYRILAGSRSESDLLNYLFHAETKAMGFPPPPLENLQPVVRELLKLNVALHGRN
jgi:hypothetical protein